MYTSLNVYKYDSKEPAIYIYIYKYINKYESKEPIADVAEWSRALDIKLSDWYINGVSSNPVEERINICQLKDLILTVWFKFQMYIYIYIYMYINECY
jgi:hypothetical protein